MEPHDLKFYTPALQIESEVHVDRARAKLDMLPTEPHLYEERKITSIRVDRKEPPTFTKPIQGVKVQEGKPAKYVKH